jgi:hypothetical protein
MGFLMVKLQDFDWGFSIRRNALIVKTTSEASKALNPNKKGINNGYFVQIEFNFVQLFLW